MRAILSKFEPTEQGVTIFFKAKHEQLQEIVALYKQEVDILPVSETAVNTTGSIIELRSHLINTLTQVIDKFMDDRLC